MAATVQDFIDRLTPRYRVILLGGVAVIGHGFTRHTQDADIWLDPMASAEAWAHVIRSVCNEFPSTTLHRLPGWTEVSDEDIADAVEETGIIRVVGLDCPLDIFRRPNEFDVADFGEVASRAKRVGDGTLLPSPLDLIQSKLDTGRNKDLLDVAHLESVVRADYESRLPSASPEEAREMLEQFSDSQVLGFALRNPSPQVRELAISHLQEFAAAGDPFSQAILEGRELL